MSERSLAVWQGWIGSKHVIRSVAEMPAGTDMQSNTEIPSSTFPSREREGSLHTLRFHSGWEDGDVAPRQYAAHSSGVDI